MLIMHLEGQYPFKNNLIHLSFYQIINEFLTLLIYLLTKLFLELFLFNVEQYAN